jgi:hypothetical protein
MVGRNSPNFAPRKKRKNYEWCKIKSLPRNRLRSVQYMGDPCHVGHTKMRKTIWGSFAHLRKSSTETIEPADIRLLEAFYPIAFYHEQELDSAGESHI